jgi:hypothetical protein
MTVFAFTLVILFLGTWVYRENKLREKIQAGSYLIEDALWSINPSVTDLCRRLTNILESINYEQYKSLLNRGYGATGTPPNQWELISPIRAILYTGENDKEIAEFFHNDPTAFELKEWHDGKFGNFSCYDKDGLLIYQGSFTPGDIIQEADPEMYKVWFHDIDAEYFYRKYQKVS